MKKLTMLGLLLSYLMGNTPQAMSSNREYALKEHQAALDKAKKLYALAEDAVGDDTGDARELLPRYERFRNMLTVLMFERFANDEKVTSLDVEDIYLCAAGVCGILDVEGLAELHTLFRRQTINIVYAPESIFHEPMKEHWFKARRMLFKSLR